MTNASSNRFVRHDEASPLSVGPALSPRSPRATAAVRRAAVAKRATQTVSLNKDAKATYTVTATVLSSATGTISNTASVTAPATTDDNVSGNNSATATTEVTASADLSIDKKDSADPVAAGHELQLHPRRLERRALGAHNVKVVDTLPAGVTFVSASGGATWSCAYSIITNKVTCDLTGTLASGASAATITVTVKAPNSPRSCPTRPPCPPRRATRWPPTTPTPRPPRSTPRPTCRSTRRTRPTPWAGPARTSATPSTSSNGGRLGLADTTSRSWTPCRPASRSSRPRAGPPGPAPTASSPTRSPAT